MICMKVTADRNETNCTVFNRCGLRAVFPWARVHVTSFAKYSDKVKVFQDLDLPINSRGFKGIKLFS